MPAASTPGFSGGWADLRGAPLYPILDAEVLGAGDPGPILRALAAAGVRVAQLRAKALAPREFLRWARAGVRGGEEAGVAVLVNDRVDVAILSGAAGAHVGQRDLSPERTRLLLGPDRMFGLSTHSTAQVRAAARAPCDYLAIGPVFPTGSKAAPEPVVGLDGVRAARRAAPGRTLVAIGGIRGDRAAAVLGAGADAFAVVSAVDGRSPARAMESARALLGAAGRG